jgi:hypothetical protein
LRPNLGCKWVILDYHFSEYPHDVLVNADSNAEAYVKAAADAGVDVFNVYAKDHWGNAYYDSKFAHKHKNVKSDLLGRILKEAHSRSLKTAVFFSVCWDEYNSRLHPDWVAVDEQGKPRRWYPTGWTFLCINSPYRDHTLSQMRELLQSYDFDAIFLDDFNNRLGVNTPCYCRHCKELWQAEYGYELPKDLVGLDKAKYLDFRDRFFRAYLNEMSTLIKSSGKDVQFSHIFGTVYDFDDYIITFNAPMGRDYFLISSQAKIYRAYGKGRPVLCCILRFNDALRDFDFTIKSKELMTWEAITILGNKGMVQITDQPNIGGELEPKAWELIKHTFSHVRRVETRVSGGVPYAEMALLYSGRDEELTQGPPYSPHEAQICVRTPDFAGAFKLLTEAHLPFDIVVTEDLTLDSLKQYRALIIPNVIHLSQAQIENIRTYVEQGGAILFTCNTATRDEYTRRLPENLQFFGLLSASMKMPYTVKFVKPIMDLETAFLRVNGEAYYVTPRARADILAYITLPAFECTSDKWVSHNIQPGDTTSHPAILLGKYGKGSYAYFAFRAFKEYIEQDYRPYRKTILSVLDALHRPSVYVEAPRVVEASYLRRGIFIDVVLTNGITGKPAGRYDLGTTPCAYHVNMDEVVPISGIKIGSKTEISEALDLEGKRLRIEKTNDTYDALLPSLGLYDVVSLKFG